MKKLLCTFAFWLLCIGLVRAADIPTKTGHILPVTSPAAAYSWTGFYVGINGGAGIMDGGPSITQTGSLSSLLPSDTTTPKGYLIGGQFGFNKQFGVWVVGLEATFDWTSIKSDNAAASSANRTFLTNNLATTTSQSMNSTKLDWLSTVVARVGITPWQHALLYGKGGLAFGRITTSSGSNVTTTANSALGATWCANGTISCPSGSGASDTSSTKTGWTLGAGLEIALDQRWSFRGEANYFDLGNVSGAYGTAGTPATISYSAAVHGWNALAGINFKF